jgi:hypothetical protein
LSDDVQITIGGAVNNTTSPVVVPWAAPAGSGPESPPNFVGGPLTVDEINAGPVNYFGHEGGHFPYFENNSVPDLSTGYKWLAITISNNNIQNLGLPQRRLTRYQRQLSRRPRALPVGESVIEQGVVTVVLKLYPKQQ